MRLHRLVPLASHPAAVYDQNVAVDIIAGGGAKKYSSAADVCRFSPLAGGNAFQYLPIAGLIALQGNRVGGAYVAGRNSVDVNSTWSPFVGERLGQLRHSSLGGGIGRHCNASLK